MRFAGAAVTKGDDVLATVDVLTAGELDHQGLVERRDGLEVEGVQALDHREPGRPDAAFDHATLAFDQLELGQSQQIAHVIDAV